MRITPLDVRKQEFRRSVRGYDCDEVRAFLSTLADEYEAVLMDNKQVREQMVEFEEKIAEYRNMERTLRDTLLTAERMTKEARLNADKESGLILKDAQLKAKQVLEECRLRTGEVRREIHALRQEKEAYLARFQSLAEAQIRFIDTHRRDFEDVDRRLLEMMEAVIAEVAGAPEMAAPGSHRPVHRPAAPASSAAPSTEDVWRRYKAGQGGSPAPEPEELDVAPPAVDVDEPTPQAPGAAAEGEKPAAPAPSFQLPWTDALEQAGSADPTAAEVTASAGPVDVPDAAAADNQLEDQQEAILEALQEVPREVAREVPSAVPDVPPSWTQGKHDLWDTLTT